MSPEMWFTNSTVNQRTKVERRGEPRTETTEERRDAQSFAERQERSWSHTCSV